MGVGALFVSTFAIRKLEEHNGEPGSQAQLLAEYLHPIVAFVVLGSVIVRESCPVLHPIPFLLADDHKTTDGLSIPFFSLGRNVHTRTLSYSVARGAQPDWLMWVRRGPAADTTTVVDANEPAVSEIREGSRISTAEMVRLFLFLQLCSKLVNGGLVQTHVEEARGDQPAMLGPPVERPGLFIVRVFLFTSSFSQLTE